MWELLLENEAEHNLLIDSVRAAVDQGAAMEWMAVVRDETAVRLIALRRPPYHLVACEPAGPCPAASEALCRSLASAFPAAAFPGGTGGAPGKGHGLPHRPAAPAHA